MKTKKIIGWVLLIAGLLGVVCFGWPILQHILHGSTVTANDEGTPWGLIISCFSAAIGFVLIWKK